MGSEGVEWICVFRDRVEWQTIANTVMNHRDSLKALIVLSCSGTGRFSRSNPFIYVSLFVCFLGVTTHCGCIFTAR
jgi:hypothetical protein